MVFDPGFSYSTLAVAESYYRAFVSSGYEVVEYDTLRGINIIKNALNHSGKKFSIEELTEWVCSPILNQIIQDKIDYLVVIHGYFMNPSVLMSVRNTGCKTILILTDDPMQVDVSPLWSKFYDYVFTNEKRTEKIHGKNCSYLPIAVDHTIFNPRRVDERHNSEILYAGSFYKERFEFIEKNEKIKEMFLYYDSIMVGARKRDFTNPELNELFKASKVSYEEMSEYVAGTQISIDIPRNEFLPGIFGDSNKKDMIRATCVSPKIFEAAASKCLPITTNERSEIRHLFPKDLIPTFDEPEELLDLIDDMINQEEKRKKIVEEIYNHCIQNHTYLERVKTIENMTTLIPSKQSSRTPNIINFHIMERWEDKWRENLAKGIKKDWFKPERNIRNLKTNKVQCCIVSNGPSLEDGILQFNENYDIFCLNEAMKIFQEKKLKFDFVVVIHPHEEVFRRCFSRTIPQGKLLISTVADYHVTEKWFDYGKEVYFFNTGNEKLKNEITKFTEYPSIGSGLTVGFTSISLAIFLGYEEIDIYGLDFCFLDNKKYAFRELLFDEVKDKELLIVKDAKGRTVLTNKVMLKSRDACINLMREHSDIKFNVYGGGILYSSGLSNVRIK